VEQFECRNEVKARSSAADGESNVADNGAEAIPELPETLLWAGRTGQRKGVGAKRGSVSGDLKRFNATDRHCRRKSSILLDGKAKHRSVGAILWRKKF
jgi:hypothetical protein